MWRPSRKIIYQKPDDYPVGKQKIEPDSARFVDGIFFGVLEANVGASRSLPTELFGGHVVPTENVSEGVDR